MAKGPNVAQNGQVVREQPKQNAIAKTGEGTLIQFVQSHMTDLGMVLPKHLTADRMARLTISAVRTNPTLAKCSLPSFAASLMACSTLGLEPNTPLGYAYLIPRWDKRENGGHGGYGCTLLVGYKGLIDLMYRSGFVSSVEATPVFEGDFFEYERGLKPRLVHRPCGEDDPAKLTHVYTIVRWKDGGEPIWDVLTRRQIERRRDRGGYDPDKTSPWKSDYVAMAQKTGVRAIARWAPTNAERPQLQQALAYEDATERRMYGTAVRALPEHAQDAIQRTGAFPVDEDPDGPDGVSVPTPQDPVPERVREPGEEG